MKSTQIRNPIPVGWGSLPLVAEVLRCSKTSLHKWGKRKKFGYRRIGPREVIVNIDEVVDFQKQQFPGIEFNLKPLAPCMHPVEVE